MRAVFIYPWGRRLPLAVAIKQQVVAPQGATTHKCDIIAKKD